MVAGLGLDEALPATGEPAPSPAELARASTLDVTELAVALDDVAEDDPETTAAAQGHLRITVKDPDQRKVGKPFTTAVVESALGAYPGMFPTAPPGEGTAFGIYWPTLIDRDAVQVTVSVDGQPVALAGATGTAVGTVGTAGAAGVGSAGDVSAGDVDSTAGAPAAAAAAWRPEPGTPLGDIVGARSGDKGGNANVGFWIPEPGAGPSAQLDEAAVAARYAWLESWLTPERVHELLPEAAGLPVDVHPLPNLRAVNVVVRGLLGRGVADSTSLDPQAKGLAEHLRARRIR
jgi:hypothetical protein